MKEPAARIHPKSVYLQIKAATRALIEAAGGGAASEALGLRVRKSNLSDYGSINKLECFAAADVIADLEASVGEPIVTRELARIAGHCLVELPQSGDDENFVSRLGHFSKSAGEVIGKLAEALGEDAIVSAAEVRKLAIIGLVDEAIEELVMLRKASLAVLAEDDHKRGRK